LILICGNVWCVMECLSWWQESLAINEQFDKILCQIIAGWHCWIRGRSLFCPVINWDCLWFCTGPLYTLGIEPSFFSHSSDKTHLKLMPWWPSILSSSDLYFIVCNRFADL
jgi:hypothetical protein